VFAYLAAQNGRAVPRDELALILWGDEPPATWEKALRVLMTKLRALLEECGLDGSAALASAFGCYKLTLPVGAWIDIEAAVEAVERAETALAAGDLAEAHAQATTAAALARRSFLPGEDASWVEQQRRELREVLVRALECLRDAAFAAGEIEEAARHAEEVTELEPFRENGYRRLMEAHAAAGNPAEALRVYERCRRFLADELGAYPSPEIEEVYREVLRAPRNQKTPAARVAASRRRALITIGGAAFLLAAVASLGLALTGGGGVQVLEVVPNSLVRIDPKTLEPTNVVPIGDAPDSIVLAGGFAWVTHYVLRDTPSGDLRNAGDRTLTRVDLTTGDSDVVGGGLAPCGMTADPSGDVWVANCFVRGSGGRANVVRVDATTLDFDAGPWPVPGGDDFYRGLAYGGGSLWLSEIVDDHCRTGSPCRPDPRVRESLTRIDPLTGRWRAIPLALSVAPVAWSGYGDLWMSNFDYGSVSRLRAKPERVDETIDGLAVNPGHIVVDGNTIWVADWSAPKVVRMHAIGGARPRSIALPVKEPAGVWNVAAGAGAVWATTPRDRRLWRIDPETNALTPIGLPYPPAGVAADDDGVWVTVGDCGRVIGCRPPHEPASDRG
jgi:DNA-binding SARP family transcriptional activator/DNA-binding beta-propeller fold protein YncE